MLCPQCSKETPAGSVFCPFCATPLGDGETATSTPTSAPSPPTPPPLSPSDSGQHGRFLPGTTVAERYRIVGLLGRGGMGEVYRADDLKLGQQVALKFLQHRFMEDEGHVARLFDEVRMARKVSHPNVCRVFDIGEAEGQHYVSMEYVDGEDLSGLLRRIGRLPGDKAVEISRQLCAALAAAHDEGVLHRDLKPANIMLDGRGRVKLTDFGLAAVAEVQAGTPIYMAPEQLAGEEVSVRSDLFALGLVLHELFTGKRVFEAGDLEELQRQHERSMTASLTSTSELDPAIDRVIQRCLEADPKARPASALAVAAGLPGADPLAAALAAGETPSPEMVAEAGGAGKIKALYGIPMLAVTLIGLLAHGAIMPRVSTVGLVPFETAPAVLEARAREIVAELGYTDEPADTAYGFLTLLNYFDWLRDDNDDPGRWDTLRQARPASVDFWWRSSPAPLVPRADSGPVPPRVDYEDPVHSTPGMLRLRLDLDGNVYAFEAVPPRVGGADDGFEPFDWSRLFAVAGLDMAAFTPVEPRFTPAGFADTRAAWEGAWPTGLEAPLRIEAAAWRGRPVSWVVFSPWRPLERDPRPAGPPGAGWILITVIFGTLFSLIFGGVYLARRNARIGRGDRRGAGRLAFFVATVWVAWWALGGTHSGIEAVGAVFTSVVWGVALGGLAWSFYMVVEPVMRRRGPHTMIGWTRLLDGRLSDPLVARDLLIGCCAGVLLSLVYLTPLFGADLAGGPMMFFGWPLLARRLGVFDTLLGGAGLIVLLSFGLFIVLLAAQVLVRNRWVAAAAISGVALLLNVISNGALSSPAAAQGVVTFLSLALLLHFGVLAYVVAQLANLVVGSFVVTLDFSVWYAPNVITALLLVGGVAAYGFYRSVEWKLAAPTLFTDEG